MNTTRRAFLAGLTAAAGSRAVRAASAAQPAGTRDPSLVALISDLHVNGLREEIKDHLYEEDCLRKVVASILALDPLPANVVCFGDIAYHWGLAEDYPLAASILKPFADAGLKLTLGMGNHDRRDTFLAQWPEYAKMSPVPGRIVTKVELPHVDLLMLDTLNAQPHGKGQGSRPGEMDAAQREWLSETLKATTKPVFTCAHHKVNENKVKIGPLVMRSPACMGHIHGHWHKWGRDIIHDGWKHHKLKPMVGLPSTGHWGDIGYAVMRTFPDRVEITNRQTDFFFTAGPGDGQPMRDDIVRELNGQTFTLRLG